MSIIIQIPTPLRRFTGERGEVSVEAATVGEALRRLVEAHTDLKPHLYANDGKLRTFVNVFKNDEDVRFLQKDATAVTAGDRLTIIPSIAGGATTVAGGGVATAAPRTVLPELSSEEIRRYSRHLILPEVGTVGQKKLKAAKVLLVGTGGLGSPSGMYLAAAGVGTLGVVDFDVVDASNLHRQLLYGQRDIGKPKLDAAAARIHDINPNVRVVPHHLRLDSSNALEVLRDYDVVVDGTDNFPTRYLVNDACVLLGKPNVYGSIFRFEGQVSVFWGARGPCYRCLFAEPPPPGLVPSCAEGGVLGVLPGIIGCLQANETIKLIVGAGDPMIGRLLLFDALRLSFRELKLRKNPDCPICSEHPTQTELIDYFEFCGVPSPEEAEQGDAEIDVTVQQLAGWLRGGEPVTVVDVRTDQEREIATIDGALHMPMQAIERRLGELDPGRRIVLFCHHGPRSTRATHLLRGAGFPKAYNLKGGIDEWSVAVDPSVARY